jgi:oxygen-independent coproporphyrinogen-3 oxidase
MSFSVYVHVPFCESRCAYCSFYSGEPVEHVRAYVDLVCKEIELRGRSGQPTGPVATLYFGGGTPSLLGARGVHRIVEAVDTEWGLEADAEISLETNPSVAVDFAGLVAAGVTRLSLGVQCFNDGLLAVLGRSHRTAEARTVLARAAQSGFASVAVDLLYGLPGLRGCDLGGWVQALADLGVAHVSAYSLEVHAGTPLEEAVNRGAFHPPDPAEEDAQWGLLGDCLERAGYRVYEVSNFARPGFQCRHSLSYWQGLPYLGLGPGAHGFEPNSGPWGCRFWNDSDLASYRDQLRQGRMPAGGREWLTQEQAVLEALFLTLRQTETIAAGSFCRRYAVDRDSLDSAFGTLREQGLLREAAPGGYSPTPDGLRRADGLALWIHARLRHRSEDSPS